MTVKNYKVELCERKEITNFIETWHYSKSINGVISDYCFKLMNDDQIIGAMIYGRVGMANVWKKYVDAPEKLIELRRLCCIDDTPKNTESYFIGKTIRWLKKNTNIKKIVSYADTTYGHTGVIYQATNFTLLGNTPPQKVINFNGKLYHDKTIRTKYKGKLKPYAQKIKNALNEDKAFYQQTKPKNIYVYNLTKR